MYEMRPEPIPKEYIYRKDAMGKPYEDPAEQISQILLKPRGTQKKKKKYVINDDWHKRIWS